MDCRIGTGGNNGTSMVFRFVDFVEEIHVRFISMCHPFHTTLTQSQSSGCDTFQIRAVK